MALGWSSSRPQHLSCRSIALLFGKWCGTALHCISTAAAVWLPHPLLSTWVPTLQFLLLVTSVSLHFSLTVPFSASWFPYCTAQFFSFCNVISQDKDPNQPSSSLFVQTFSGQDIGQLWIGCLQISCLSLVQPACPVEAGSHDTTHIRLGLPIIMRGAPILNQGWLWQFYSTCPKNPMIPHAPNTTHTQWPSYILHHSETPFHPSSPLKSYPLEDSIQKLSTLWKHYWIS